MKRHIPTFEQFVNEAANDANGYDPIKVGDNDPTLAVAKSLDELLPGKEYVLTIGGKANTDMIYAGYSDGVHIFNEADHNAEPISFTDAELQKLIDAKGVAQVAGF